MTDSRLYDDNMILPPRMGTAVYAQDGQVVIEQRDDYSNDYEIRIDPENAVALVYAILEAAGLPMEIVEVTPEGYYDVPRPTRHVEPAAEDSASKPKPKDPTAAERMRRYRDRRKATVTTDRNAVTEERNAIRLIAAE